MKPWEIIEDDCRARMAAMLAASIDAIVTDPPYALTANKRGGSGEASLNTDSPAGRSRIGTGGGFMGQKWDSELPGVETWEAALRVAKPGAHLVAFGGTRTFHRLTCAIEDAGWEIRDCLSWLYGQGFPKSLNLGEGWGTGLKPAWEPIVLARKPLEGSVAANRAKYGTGVLNIDGCRIEGAAGSGVWGSSNQDCQEGRTFNASPDGDGYRYRSQAHPGGRWPANVALDVDAALQLDEQSGELVSGANPTRRGSPKFRNTYGEFVGQEECEAARGQDAGGASRFFYCPKADRTERNAGLDGPERPLNWSSGEQSPGTFQSPNTKRRARNFHPTVKPVELMRWLCRLVTPPGGLVLDPFCGSGSTGIAALREGFAFIGIEREPDYCELARRRIAEDAPLLNGRGE